MTFVEPPQQHARLIPSNPKNVYQGRWRLWYSMIADELMKDPTISLAEIAKRTGKNVTTIKFIVNTDLFRDYLSQRRTAHTLAHDQAIRDKVVKMATVAIDNIVDRFEKKGDQVPMKLAADIALGALEKLGYGTAPAAGPAVAVQVNNTNAVQVQPAALSELEQARATLRAAEEARRNRVVPIPPYATEPVGVAGDPVRGDAAVIVGELMEDIQGASNE